MVDWERTETVRYWLEFDLTGHEPNESDGPALDGGTTAARYLSNGVGVTGYTEDDCLAMLREVIGEELPPLVRVVKDIDVDSVPFAPNLLGNPAWRGVWFPPLNRSGPTQ